MIGDVGMLEDQLASGKGFDLVYCEQVLEHVEALPGFLRLLGGNLTAQICKLPDRGRHGFDIGAAVVAEVAVIGHEAAQRRRIALVEQQFDALLVPSKNLVRPQVRHAKFEKLRRGNFNF